MVMPANQTNELVHLWAGLYGGVGHLYTPARKERIRPWLAYALDNGRYAEATAIPPIEFDEIAFMIFIEDFCAREQRPIWIAVPDVPFDAQRTIEWWNRWAPILRKFGVPLALCVQDGMTPEGVDALEDQPDAIFLGGSTAWKWKTVPIWAAYCKRKGIPLHVGRVNAPDKLEYLASLGIASCDGSGWFKGKAPQCVGLGRFLARQAGQDPDYAERCALATRYAHRDQYSLVPLMEATA